VGIVYFKRYRMEVDLAQPLFPQPDLADEYRLVAWDDRLIDAHAETKFRCFHWELDANVFPSLSTRDGCRRLMTEISRRSGFIPQATWLLEYWPQQARKPELIGNTKALPTTKSGRSRTSASPNRTWPRPWLRPDVDRWPASLPRELSGSIFEVTAQNRVLAAFISGWDLTDEGGL
jgi:hypothetical protein